LLPLEASTELWQKVARVNADELDIALQHLAKQGIVKERHFAHPLFRDVTLKTLSPERKQNLSRRAIHALEDNPVQASGFVEDAKLENEKAIDILKQAAFYLETVGKKKEAFQCLEKALSYTTVEDKDQLVLKVAQLASKAGDSSKALALAQQAAQYLDDPLEAQKLIALSYGLLGDYEKMKVTLKQLNKKIDDNFLLECLSKTDVPEDIIKRLASFQFERLNSSSIYFIGRALMEAGNLDTALKITEEQLQHKEKLGILAKAELLDIRSSVLHYQGKYEEADLIFSEVIELYIEEGKSWNGAANALRNRATNRLHMGLCREAVTDYHKSLELYSELGTQIRYAETLVMVSVGYFELAEYDMVLDAITNSLKILETLLPKPLYVHALSMLATLYMTQQTGFGMVLATKYMNLASEFAKQLNNPLHDIIVKIDLATLSYHQNQLEASLAYADEALQLASSSDITIFKIKASVARALVLGKLGYKKEALPILEEAIQEASVRNMLFDTHYFALELDRLNNDVEGARTRMQWFEERGLMNGVNIAKRYFPELAEKPHNIAITETMPQILVLGTLQLSQNKPPQHLRGNKRQELLALLLQAKLSGRTEVNKLELSDALYTSDDLKASNRLKSLVNSLRDSLGVSSILTTAHGYVLGSIDSDAEQFLKTGDTRLWRGQYLEGLTIDTQETVKETLYLMLFERAKTLQQSDPKEAARVAKILLMAEPYDQDYLRLCLQALKKSSHHKSLTELYTEATERFLEVGETLPQQWQDFLDN
jgi:tetratricopeptide (TPR) repeat protein